MAAFVPSLSSLPTGRHHAAPSLSCSHRQQLPVATVPRRCQPVMSQAGSAEQQQAGPAEQRRAFDQRMNRMCNEVVRRCPPCLCIFFFCLPGVSGEVRRHFLLATCNADAGVVYIIVFSSSFMPRTCRAAGLTGQDHSARLCRRRRRTSQPSRRCFGRLRDPFGGGVPFSSRPGPY